MDSYNPMAGVPDMGLRDIQGRAARRLTRREALSVLSEDAMIEAVRREDERRRGKGRTGYARVVR